MQPDYREKMAECIAKIKEIAELQGKYLTLEQVDECLMGIELKPAEKELIFDYLKRENIHLGELPDASEVCTPMELDYLEIYLQELKSLPQYREGEKEVWYREAIQQKPEAIKKVIEIFLPKVPDIAKIYVGQGVSIEELICEGNVALTVAAGMLDSQETCEDVEELLAQMVMNAMQELIEQEKRQSDADDSMLQKINRVMEAGKELYENYLRKATMEEVAKETGYSIKTIREIDQLTSGSIEYMESEFEKNEEV